MPNLAIARYRDAAGRPHDVLVRQTRTGQWQILDVVRVVSVVDTLTNPDDGRPEAEAIARDYANNQQQRAADEARVAA